MQLIKSISQYVGADPARAAVFAAAGAVLGYLLSFLGQWMQARATLAAEQMKLRHEIVKRWLVDFDEQIAKVRRCHDSLRDGYRVTRPSDLDGLLEWFGEFDASLQRLLDRALVGAIGFGTHGRNPPARIVYEAAVAVFMSSIDAFGWFDPAFARVCKKLESGSDKHSPIDLTITPSAEWNKAFVEKLTALCALVNWAAEERLARRQFRVQRHDISRLLARIQKAKEESDRRLRELAEAANGSQ